MQFLPYYANHFLEVIAALEKHYAPLLSVPEITYIEQMRCLPAPSLCLYVRLVNRRGPYFHLAKLYYEECAPLEATLAPLLDAGLLMECQTGSLPFSASELLESFTLTELRLTLANVAPKKLGKAELCNWIEAVHSESIGTLLTQHRIIAWHPKDHWPFLKFLFFGELTDNLSGFVVQELGHIVTERAPESLLSPYFTSREIAESCYHMARLYQDFRRLRQRLTALQLFNWWQAQTIQRAHLPTEALPTHTRLSERLGRLLEREEYFKEAKAIYADCSAPPCRERVIRLLLKENRKFDAIALCEQILLETIDDEERYGIQQILARLEKKQRSSQPRQVLNQAQHLLLEDEGLGIEQSVLRHFETQRWHGVHSENWLWNALFGLLLWDVIYDPTYGTFHHPLQIAPADLYHQDFYRTRAFLIEHHLALLNNKTFALHWIASTVKEKTRIANPFIYWHEGLLPLVSVFVERLPASGLIPVLRHMAQDLNNRTRGFPDLFLWNDREYQLIEVKSATDQLSGRQCQWLHFMQEHGIEVKVLKALRAQQAQFQEA